MSKVQKKKKTIAIATGGTKGHVKPAQMIAEMLSMDDTCRVIVFIDQKALRFWKKNDEQKNIEIVNLGFLKRWGKIGLFLFGLPLAFLRSIYYFFKYKIDLCIGFGAYTAFCPMLTSVLLDVPLIIHEQNAMLGRVNKLFLKVAKKVFFSFPRTLCTQSTKMLFEINDNIGERYYHVWNPIFYKNDIERRERNIKWKNRVLSNDKEQKKTIVITSGSQGSSKLTYRVIEAFGLISDKEKKANLMIYHQAANDYAERMMAQYQYFGIENVIIQPFFEDMESLLDKADLFIGRGGSCTIFEAIESCTPSILIPAAKAKDDHQFHNVMFFVSEGACSIVRENGSNESDNAEIPTKLHKAIEELLYNDFSRINMIANMKKFQNVGDSLHRCIKLIYLELTNDYSEMC